MGLGMHVHTCRSVLHARQYSIASIQSKENVTEAIEVDVTSKFSFMNDNQTLSNP